MRIRLVGALIAGLLAVAASAPARAEVTAVKLSIHAIVLQMAAEKEFGLGRHEELDRLTVSLPHPEAMASLLSSGTEITAHLTTAPFKSVELKDTRIHRILSSNALTG